MSKKHFIALANTVRRMLADIDNCSESHPTRDSNGYQDGRENLIRTDRVRQIVLQDLAGFCADQNGRFDRSRWLDYIAGECGPNGGKSASGKAAR